jgi:hypothetical protein
LDSTSPRRNLEKAVFSCKAFQIEKIKTRAETLFMQIQSSLAKIDKTQNNDE